MLGLLSPSSFVHLQIKWLEQFVFLCCIDPLASVYDVDLEHLSLIVVGCFDRDLPVMGRLESILGQVDQDLLEPNFVT